MMDDTCSILQLLEKSVDSNNPEKELMISTDRLVRVHQDLLLLENQIPYKWLKVICNNTARLKRCMHNFLIIHGIKEAYIKVDGHGVTIATAYQEEEEEEEEPFHLLDYLRRKLLRRDKSQIHDHIEINPQFHNSVLKYQRKYKIGSIRELKAAGIQVTKSPNSNSFYPFFTNGKLQLPQITVDGSTAIMLLNLIAYEMCPDFNNNFEISSFLVFLSSLIDQPEDVKELRNIGILRNELASDEEVVDIFNKMNVVLVPKTYAYVIITHQIKNHFMSRRGKINRWMGEAYNSYFRSPWTIITLLAAILGLTLTFVQTWYAIHSKGS